MTSILFLPLYRLGAYYTASAATHRLITISLSKYLDARVFAINYRLAPDTRFPGPVHDAVSAYLRLTEDLGVPPGNVIVAGDSAGGGLCLALMMYLRDEGYPLPGAAVLMCPWVGEYVFRSSFLSVSKSQRLTFWSLVDPPRLNDVLRIMGNQRPGRRDNIPYGSSGPHESRRMLPWPSRNVPIHDTPLCLSTLRRLHWATTSTCASRRL